MRSLTTGAALAAVLFLVLPDTPVYAQAYPTKPVRIVVGFSPGGATDIIARIVAQRLTEAWGQSVIVENRPGASGMIGAELVSKTAPDGYTLLMSPQTSMAVAPNIFAKIAYDPVRDFAAVTMPASAPMLLVVHPSLPVTSFQQFVALAKSHPGRLSFGSGGIGTGPHMSGELLKTLLGLKIVHVPYKGEGPAITDVIAGQIPFILGTLPAVIQHVQSGRLRGVAVTTARRTSLAPQFPTIAESGLAEFDTAIWLGMFAPAGTSREIVNRIYSDTARLLGSQEAQDKLAQQGLEPVASTPEQFSAYLKAELVKWGKVVKAANVRVE